MSGSRVGHRLVHWAVGALLVLAACDGGGGGSLMDATVPEADLDCVVGTLTCACGPSGGCAVDDDGETLECLAGVCLRPPCQPGAPGCRCTARGSDCDRGASCVSGVCLLNDCAEGSESCGCAAGGSCDPGLFCRDELVCVDRTGFEGGDCLANGLCHPGGRCERASDRCVFCDRGTEGCACNDSGGCGEGLGCAAGLCVSASDLPPEDPACFTPCLRDLSGGADTRVCDAEGLLPGCIDDRACVDGSCLLPGEDKPSCADDRDCPFFQTCLAGGCYSDCDSSLDCASGLGCHRRVCRVPCSMETGASGCPAAMTCDSSDGETGFCVVTAPPAAVPVPAPSAPTLEVVTEELSFSNLRTQANIQIRPEGEGTQTIVIRKVLHRLTEQDGRTESVAQPADEDGAPLGCEGVATDCPLWWLEMSAGGVSTRGDTLEVEIPGGCGDDCPVITLSNAAGSPGVLYDGRLQITGPGGSHSVTLAYAEQVDGRWEGQVHYFATFDDEGIDAWLSREDRSDTEGVDNAFLQRWGAFRRGNLEGFQELEAVLTSTRTGSWELGRTQELCDAVTGGADDAVCYPFTNAAGVRVYVDNVDESPVPSATSELPIAFHVRQSRDDPTILVGKIDSATALQYPGDPAVSFQLAANPSVRPPPAGSDRSVGSCDPAISSDCVIFLTGMRADVAVGGRYVSPDGACDTQYEAFSVPWLVPGFIEGTRAVGERRFRTECRDVQVPFDTGADAADRNADLSRANPAPDGLPRRRSLELLDGALVNQGDLVVLFRETFPSYVPRSAPAAAYGFMTLRRSASELEDEDFQGNPIAPEMERNPPDTATQCDADALGLPASLVSACLSEGGSECAGLVRVLIDGSAAAADLFGLEAVALAAVADEIHYLCGATGELDGGGSFEGAVHLPSPCPDGSEVTFFDTGGSFTQDEVRRQECQSSGTCASLVEEWRAGGLVAEAEPAFGCTDPGSDMCDAAEDRRQGKTFYRLAPGAPLATTFPPLRDQINQAFRYKTQFQSTLFDDSSVGFTPVICRGTTTPYCYEPEEIVAVRRRVDCLVDVYTNRIDAFDTADTDEARARRDLERFVREQFSEGDIDGFERLYAELLIMLGDEELTQAFASRFDLAGVATRTFEGTRFEPAGIDLTGVAGAEMQRLYASIQYYQLGLDRLYGMGPTLAAALGRGSTNDPRVLISPETVSLYLTRLVRASTQKSLAWSEIGRRYLEFQQLALARRVLERAYAQTYLESVLFSQLMLDIAEGSSVSFRAQIVREIEQAQRRYRIAMLDMVDVFDDVVGERTFFGFPPEYVPFPAIDSTRDTFGNNGFEALLRVARERLSLAKEREQIAIDSLVSGRTEAAQFQSELVRVRNSFEDQLADTCGTFVADDGRRLPAIRKYANLSNGTRLLGDPCGLVDNGQIFEQMLQVQSATLALEASQIRLRNSFLAIEEERRRVNSQCALSEEIADYHYNQGSRVASMRANQARIQAGLGIAARTIGAVGQAVGEYVQCTAPADGPSKAVCAGLASVSGGLGIVSAALESAGEFTAIAKQAEIAERELASGHWVALQHCDALQIDSNAVVAGLVRSLDETELDYLRALEALRLEVAEVKRTFHQAQRVQLRQRETEELLINVEAARNDPNVRLFRNEAVINADIAFDDAMRAAYRATRMYEYYTSTSYARLDELFVIRLAARGRPNLENYLLDLENAFFDFEEEIGLPDARLAILSLRDDILRVPLLDDAGNPIPDSARSEMLQEALQSPDYLDTDGYIAIPFGTALDELSPLTRNHKIRFVEANIIGSRIGDRLGRIYLRRKGTGVIRTVDDDLDFYVFPERTAVVDTFFNGQRVFSPEIYQNLRFRDRPFVNTMWELLINRRDEAVNRDIDLGSISDIQIFIHYTDFTAL